MTWTNTIIIALIAGVVSCLCLVLLIVHGIRRFYKPARPRIKKTFVVRRQPAASSDTPLTNRPIATEQCEITIENCCNMNYCDTVSINYCYTNYFIKLDIKLFFTFILNSLASIQKWCNKHYPGIQIPKKTKRF